MLCGRRMSGLRTSHRGFLRHRRGRKVVGVGGSGRGGVWREMSDWRMSQAELPAMEGTTSLSNN